MADDRIQEAAKELRRIDRAKGERTVGIRYRDAAECGRAQGLVISDPEPERHDPLVDQILQAAGPQS